jgi:hypothetical protein
MVPCLEVGDGPYAIFQKTSAIFVEAVAAVNSRSFYSVFARLVVVQPGQTQYLPTQVACRLKQIRLRLRFCAGKGIGSAGG